MKKDKQKGILFVISGASGSGKTTLCHSMTEKFKDVIYSISTTTRPKRGKEKDGKDYFFISKDKFKKNKKDFIEWAVVYGEYYGTSKRFINKAINSGRDVVMDVDTVGAKKIKKAIKDSVLIFVLPPNKAELKKRLINRKTDSKEIIRKRLALALSEIEQMACYDYIILNDKLASAGAQMMAIIIAERAKKSRNLEIYRKKIKK